MASQMLTAPGDPAVVAAVITGREEFPGSVLRERHPELLAKVLRATPYPPVIRAAVEALAEEIEGPILPLSRSASTSSADADSAAHGDAAAWARWSAPYLGRSWYDVPFLWAENYFYRKLLDATGWFAPGPWQGVDPFGPQKDAELTGTQVRAELAALSRLNPVASAADDGVLDALLLAALWGNRADLGFQLQRPGDRSSPESTHLLVDDRSMLRGHLSDADRIILITDNVGAELVPDLALVDLLLLRRPAATVWLHVKPSPYFTSDATPRDVVKTVRHLTDGPPESSDLGRRLSGFISEGRLCIFTHPFYVAPLTYVQAPDDLKKRYAAVDITLMKGDLNYRRLVGDAAWPATVPFDAVTAHWPGRVAALRTLKSDVLTGLDAERLERLDRSGEKWRTSGSYAVIQVR